MAHDHGDLQELNQGDIVYLMKNIRYSLLFNINLECFTWNLTTQNIQDLGGNIEYSNTFNAIQIK